MEALLPSEIARLVVGYLEDQKCDEAAKMFLDTSPYLEECRMLVAEGKTFRRLVYEMTLIDILQRYCSINAIVQERMSKVADSEQLKQCGDFLEQLRLLIDGSRSQRFVVNINVPSQNSAPNTGVSPIISGSVRKRQRSGSERDRDRCKRFAKTLPLTPNKQSSSQTVYCDRPEATPVESLPGHIDSRKSIREEKYAFLKQKSKEVHFNQNEYHDCESRLCVQGTMSEHAESQVSGENQGQSVNEESNRHQNRVRTPGKCSMSTNMEELTKIHQNIGTQSWDQILDFEEMVNNEPLENLSLLGKELLHCKEIHEQIAENINKSGLLPTDLNYKEDAIGANICGINNSGIFRSIVEETMVAASFQQFVGSVLKITDSNSKDGVNDKNNSPLNQKELEQDIINDIHLVSDKTVNKAGNFTEGASNDKVQESSVSENGTNSEVDNGNKFSDLNDQNMAAIQSIINANSANIESSQTDEKSTNVEQVTKESETKSSDPEPEIDNSGEKGDNEDLDNSVEIINPPTETNKPKIIDTKVIKKGKEHKSSKRKESVPVKKVASETQSSEMMLTGTLVFCSKDDPGSFLGVPPTYTTANLQNPNFIPIAPKFVKPVYLKEVKVPQRVTKKIKKQGEQRSTPLSVSNPVTVSLQKPVKGLITPVPSVISISDGRLPSLHSEFRVQNSLPSIVTSSQIFKTSVETEPVKNIIVNIDSTNFQDPPVEKIDEIPNIIVQNVDEPPIQEENIVTANPPSDLEHITLYGNENSTAAFLESDNLGSLNVDASMSFSLSGLSPFLKMNKVRRKDSEQEAENTAPTQNESITTEAVNISTDNITTDNITFANTSIDNAKLPNLTLENTADVSSLSAIARKSELITKRTPKSIIKSRSKNHRLSLSTPRRRNSHVRALDFGTPPKSSSSASKSTSKSSPGSLNRSKSHCRTSLFKSPPFANSSDKDKSPDKELCSIPIATRSPAPKLMGEWEKFTGMDMILGKVSPNDNSNSALVEKVPAAPQSSKVLKSWDTELRQSLNPKLLDAEEEKKVKAKTSKRVKKSKGTPGSKKKKGQSSKRGKIKGKDSESRELSSQNLEDKEEAVTSKEFSSTEMSTLDLSNKDSSDNDLSIKESTDANLPDKNLVSNDLSGKESSIKDLSSKELPSQELISSKELSSKDLSKDSPESSILNVSDSKNTSNYFPNDKSLSSCLDESEFVPEPTPKLLETPEPDPKVVENVLSVSSKKRVDVKIIEKKSGETIKKYAQLTTVPRSEVSSEFLKASPKKRVLIPNMMDLETPRKIENSLGIPPTPRFLSPNSSSITPFAKTTRSEDSSKIPDLFPTPDFAPTPGNKLTPNLAGENTKDAIKKGELSSCSPYYQPSSEIEEMVKIQSKNVTKVAEFQVIKVNLPREEAAKEELVISSNSIEISESATAKEETKIEQAQETLAESNAEKSSQESESESSDSDTESNSSFSSTSSSSTSSSDSSDTSASESLPPSSAKKVSIVSDVSCSSSSESFHIACVEEIDEMIESEGLSNPIIKIQTAQESGKILSEDKPDNSEPIIDKISSDQKVDDSDRGIKSTDCTSRNDVEEEKTTVNIEKKPTVETVKVAQDSETKKAEELACTNVNQKDSEIKDLEEKKNSNLKKDLKKEMDKLKITEMAVKREVSPKKMFSVTNQDGNEDQETPAKNETLIEATISETPSSSKAGTDVPTNLTTKISEIMTAEKESLNSKPRIKSIQKIEPIDCNTLKVANILNTADERSGLSLEARAATVDYDRLKEQLESKRERMKEALYGTTTKVKGNARGRGSNALRRIRGTQPRKIGGRNPSAVLSANNQSDSEEEKVIENAPKIEKKLDSNVIGKMEIDKEVKETDKKKPVKGRAVKKPKAVKTTADKKIKLDVKKSSQAVKEDQSEVELERKKIELDENKLEAGNKIETEKSKGEGSKVKENDVKLKDIVARVEEQKCMMKAKVDQVKRDLFSDDEVVDQRTTRSKSRKTSECQKSDLSYHSLEQIESESNKSLKDGLPCVLQSLDLVPTNKSDINESCNELHNTTDSKQSTFHFVYEETTAVKKRKRKYSLNDYEMEIQDTNGETCRITMTVTPFEEIYAISPKPKKRTAKKSPVKVAKKTLESNENYEKPLATSSPIFKAAQSSGKLSIPTKNDEAAKNDNDKNDKNKMANEKEKQKSKSRKRKTSTTEDQEHAKAKLAALDNLALLEKDNVEKLLSFLHGPD